MIHFNQQLFLLVATIIASSLLLLGAPNSAATRANYGMRLCTGPGTNQGTKPRTRGGQRDRAGWREEGQERRGEGALRGKPGERRHLRLFSAFGRASELEMESPGQMP